jgi:hypothetical protein
MANQYEIYVADASGWCDGCPDMESQFFSPEPEETYIHPVNGGHPEAGSLIVTGFQRAKSRLFQLRTSGDWKTYDGEMLRPEYEMRKVERAKNRIGKHVPERRIA